MKMQFKTITLIAIFAMSLLIVGCGESPNTTPNVNTANANVNGAKPANAGLDASKTPEVATTNAAPTLGPIVHAYYDGLKKKDAAAVKAAMSKEFLASIEDEMKEEKKTDIVAFLTEFDKLPTDKMEVRNEQISGAKGTAELKGGSYGDWVQVVFRNEGGTWKITNEVDRK